MRRKNSALWLILCVAWILMIFMFSRQDGSTSHGISQSVSGFIGGIMHPDFGSWPMSQRQEWQESFDTLLRKMAHFAEYMLLGILAFLSINGICNARKRRKTVSPVMRGLFAFYPCVMIGTVDEMIQIYSVNRGASVADIVLDCIGALSGILLVIYHKKNKVLEMPETDQAVVRHRKG